MRPKTALLAALPLLLAAASADAALYDWTYADPQRSGSGTLTVTGSTVTAITGSFAGNGIIQLVTDGSCCGAPGADNAFSPTGPHLSGNGMAFQTFGDPGFFDIAWNASFGSYTVLDDSGVFTSNGSFGVTLQGVGETRVPEPASFALLGLGVAALLGMGRRRRS